MMMIPNDFRLSNIFSNLSEIGCVKLFVQILLVYLLRNPLAVNCSCSHLLWTLFLATFSLLGVVVHERGVNDPRDAAVVNSRIKNEPKDSGVVRFRH